VHVAVAVATSPALAESRDDRDEAAGHARAALHAFATLDTPLYADRARAVLARLGAAAV